jgi:DNA-binding response OmpR family regulator
MKKHVLVIDEGRLMCYGLKRALSQEWIKVDTAFTVTEAVTTFGTSNYDLCLFDLCPPDEKGFSLMRVIRNTWPLIKIILMSANDFTLYGGTDEIIHQARTNGASHLLRKPFCLKSLKKIVSQLLGGHGDDDGDRNNFLIGTKRKAERKAWSKTIHFSRKLIRDGEIRRLNFPAESVNITKYGILLITTCLLSPTDIVSFDDENLGQKVGVVIWCNQLDDRRYRVGIKFS